MGTNKLKFDLSRIDCSGPRLESLIVYYRPDLFNTFHIERRRPFAEMADAGAEAALSPEQEEPAAAATTVPPASILSQRIARLR